MGEQPKKPHISAGLLAHVSSFRREPHFYTHIPGPKTGDFSYPAEVRLLQGLKTPPYAVVSSKQNPQHMVAAFRNVAL